MAVSMWRCGSCNMRRKVVLWGLSPAAVSCFNVHKHVIYLCLSLAMNSMRMLLSFDVDTHRVSWKQLFIWLGVIFRQGLKNVHTRVLQATNQTVEIDMTSSKCVLQQRHLLGYESEPEPWTLTLTLGLTLTLTLFLTLTVTKFLKENKNNTRI